MKKSHLLPAWGRILRGRPPLLSIEITKECPLRCPGCYAYEPEHLNAPVALRQLSDYRGDRLVEGVLALVRRHRPLHLSVVGGEPLVRYRELDELLPRLCRMGVEVQLVTSAVRPIPAHWASLECLHLVVSIDGLPEEHDRRRTPATWDRILKHIQGHEVIAHCTVTRQMLARPGYLEACARLWSDVPAIRRIWYSLFTPQEGQECDERLTAEDRAAALDRLEALPERFPKVHMPRLVIEGYRSPPQSPEECIFARTTLCVSADLERRVTPCQFGGKPVCRECGCMASAGLTAIGRYRLGGMVPVSAIFAASQGIGRRIAAAD